MPTTRSVNWIGQATALFAWLSLVLIGMTLLWKYNMAPGGFHSVPETWPAESQWRLSGEKLQLVMFVHPQCPCSRASLGELAVLQRRRGNLMDIRVAFISPPDQSDEWTRSGLWRQAGSIPGVEVSIDANGKEAALFGAETSGATTLYDSTGNLLFKGGITAARGHFGDNVGRKSIEQFAEGHTGALKQTAVFGCPLKDQPMNAL